MPPRFDWIVIGAGAAGCVVASRLSEDASVSVLLIEAGADLAPGAEPADIRDTYPASYFNKRYFWPGLGAHWSDERTGRETGFPQARVMGGGGSVMGMVALRGVPADYADWRAAGCPGWDWPDVLPFFRRLETDCDFQGPLHGDAGPMPVRRLPRREWTPLAQATARWAEAQGWPHVADMNADFRDGCGAVPMTNTGDARASSASCYLGAAVRRRANLHIQAATQATRLRLEGRRVVGVDAETAGRPVHYAAGRVVVSAGAIFTPALLMRSGIGPASELQRLGIPVAAARAGVGGNLQNHPVLYLGVHLRRGARQADALRPSAVNCVRYSSGLPGCPPADQYLNVQSKTSWNAMGRQIGNISSVLLRPFSRGRVSLRSADAQALPRVEFSFLSDPRDLARMAQGFGRAAALALYCIEQGICGAAFAVRFGDRLRRLNERRRGNAVKASLLAGLLDGVPALSGPLLAALTGERIDLRRLCADPAALQAHARDHVAGLFHPAGTCVMGPAADAAAVAATDGSVHGIGGLYIADASLMPSVPAGNTHLPTLMVAEKIAAGLARAAAA